MGFCSEIREEHAGFFEFASSKAGIGEVGLFVLYLHFLKKNTKLKSLKLDEFWDFFDKATKE